MKKEPDILISSVQDKDEMIAYWPFIKQTHLCDGGDPALILQECLAGHYLMSKGTVDGKLVGVVVFNPLLDGSCFVHILHLKNYVTTFKKLFFQTCKAAGYRRILASTNIPEKTYTRLTGLKKLYSVYEHDLTKEDS